MQSRYVRFHFSKTSIGIARRTTLFLTFVLFALTAAQLSHAQTEVILHSFAGGADGAKPAAGLIFDSSGNLYGTTFAGGGSTACASGCGTAFKITARVTESVLHNFAGGTDGAAPYGGVIRNAKGDLFGTTTSGGFYVGTVFELAPSGAETLLHTFTSSTTGDGAVPFASVVEDGQGNLYGTTYSGGAECVSSGGCGTVFKITTAGTEELLYSFAGGSDGSFPFCSLTWAGKSDLYGTTVFGGAYNYGTVFRITTSGKETVVYSFTGGADGAGPEAGLVRDSKGSLYGTTSAGGAYGHGTVFKVAPTGQETVLYSFTGGADGDLPASSLILDAKNNLYGTTYQGGASGLGTVYEISPSGVEKVLYSFAGGTDGSYPTSALLRDAKANLYGTTNQGGADGLGTVFKIIP
jgi:uncharacterized repeat protein (TIGR03803 family)